MARNRLSAFVQKLLPSKYKPQTRQYSRTGEARFAPTAVSGGTKLDGKLAAIAWRYDRICYTDYDMLRMYPIVRDCLNVRRKAALTASFHFECSDQARADAASQILEPIIMPMLNQMVAGKLHWGNQTAEKIWEPMFDVTVTSGQATTGADPKTYPMLWGIKRFGYFDPSDTILLLDQATGELAGIQQYISVPSDDDRQVPVDKLIHMVNDSEFNSLYGMGAAKAAKPFVDLAVSIYDDLKVHSRFFSNPFKILWYLDGFTVTGKDENGNSVSTPNSEIARSLGASIEAGGTIVLPVTKNTRGETSKTWDFSIEQAQGTSDEYVAKITHVNDMIRVSMSVPSYAASTSPSSGTYTLGKSVIDMFLKMADYEIQECAGLVDTQILPEWNLVNFGDDSTPITIVFSPPEIDARRAIVTALLQGIGAGTPFTDAEGNGVMIDMGKVAKDVGLPVNVIPLQQFMKIRKELGLVADPNPADSVDQTEKREGTSNA